MATDLLPGSSVHPNRDRLIVTHLHLVPPIARRIHKSLPPSFDLEDLIGTGNFALVRAAMLYKPEEHGGAPFGAYARLKIDGEIRESTRRRRYLEHTRFDLKAEFEDIPTPATIEDQLQKETLLNALQAALRRLPRHQRRLMGMFYADARGGANSGNKRAAWRRQTPVKRLHDQTLARLRSELRKCA